MAEGKGRQCNQRVVDKVICLLNLRLIIKLNPIINGDKQWSVKLMLFCRIKHGSCFHALQTQILWAINGVSGLKGKLMEILSVTKLGWLLKGLCSNLELIITRRSVQSSNQPQFGLSFLLPLCLKGQLDSLIYPMRSCMDILKKTYIHG